MIGQICVACFSRRLFLLVVALCLSNASWGGDRFEVVSQRTFDQTIQQLEWAFGGYGLTKVSSMDYQQILKKVRFDSGRAVVFEVMRREWLKTLMSADPALGATLPVRIYVYERNDGKTVVVYRRPGDEIATHDNTAVNEFGKKLDQKLDAIVAQAARVRLSQKETELDSK